MGGARASLAIAGLAAGLAGCAAGSGPPPVDPCAATFDPDSCLLPWPRGDFLVADATTRTGYRLHLPLAAMPVDARGAAVDPAPWNLWDGFEPMTTLVAQFGSVIDRTPLPPWHDPGRSLSPDSPTVLFDADLGRPVAHFAETESAPDVAPGHSTLYLRPAARLAEGHHFVAAVRGLSAAGGGTVAVSPLFQSLRDRAASAPKDLAARYERDVFGPLASAGIDRSTLLLAWDFRTASGRTAWGDLVAMRDAAFAAAGAAGLACAVDNVVEDPNDTLVFRQIEGRVTIPAFLENGVDGRPRIARDASGTPAQKGTLEAQFVALISQAAVARRRAGQGAAPVLLYGHGLFSDHTELERDFGRQTIQKASAIGVATDFSGMTLADQGTVAGAFTDVSAFPPLIDRLRQALINTLLLPRTIAGACSARAEFQLDGQPIADGGDLDYFGNSLGGTLGHTVAALSPDIQRFALGVAGIDLPLMMPRATGFATLEAIFAEAFPRRIDRDLLIVMTGHVWEFVEGSFAPHVLADPLPGSSTKQVLFQMGLNDTSSTNLASVIAGRTLGLGELTPSSFTVWGLSPLSAPASSAFVVYDLGFPTLPDSTVAPAMANGVHEGVRRDPRAQAQLVAFLHAGGSVVDTCSGACAPP
jgi:hypothetical protein